MRYTYRQAILNVAASGNLERETLPYGSMNHRLPHCARKIAGIQSARRDIVFKKTSPRFQPWAGTKLPGCSYGALMATPDGRTRWPGPAAP
jgi:hypothetical protein